MTKDNAPTLVHLHGGRYVTSVVTSKEQVPMTDIVISEEKLRKVNSIKEDKAKEIVKSTRATVNGKQAKVTRHQNSITVSLAPEAVKAFEDDFVDGLWIIQLITDKDEM